MKKIGMLVAVEISAVVARYATELETLDCKAFTVYKCHIKNCELYILQCGAGQIAAAAGTQFLIDRFEVELVVNFGIVGGLTPEMSLAKACIVENVVHYDFDTSAADNCEVGRYIDYPEVNLPLNSDLIELALSVEPSLKKVTCASGDKFIDTKEHKEYLHKTFGADIVEMEAAALVLICDRNNIPCVSIKTVSDSITGGADEFKKEFDRTAAICLQVVDKLLSSF